MRRTALHLLLLRLVLRWLTLLALLCAGSGASAQGIELAALQLKRSDAALTLDYSARLTLSPAVEDALHRGVPIYFTAQATLMRNRWYWRDERVARVSRSWRLSYQPLSAQWRVSLGGLAQTFATLSEALAQLSRVGGWRLLEVDKLDSGEHYYVEFSFLLDSTQLPRPMQFDLGSDWKLGVERVLRVDQP